MKTLTLTKYGKSHQITFELNRYTNNGNLYVGMIAHENGYPEPWSRLTVNLGKCLEGYAYVDTNNNGIEIYDWLCENEIGWPTGTERRSGFCAYPEFEFNMEKLLEYTSSGAHFVREMVK